MVDSEQFRQAWARFATGVSVVTSIERGGGVHGMTAQGICSVSMDPMLALVCVGHNRHSHEHISESRRFCINILNVDQQGIAEHFAMPPERRDAAFDVPLSFTETGAAVIEDSLASLDCRVVADHVAGDHTIFIGEVDEIRLNDSGGPLTYYRSEFGRLA